jgi:hypothetical protein
MAMNLVWVYYRVPEFQPGGELEPR